MKIFLSIESGVTRGAVPDIEHYKELAEDLRSAQRRMVKHREKLKSKDLEIFQLKHELRAAKEQAEGAPDVRSAPQVADESETGALPDFVIIGAHKSGTTFLYRLLTQHPHVESAALKELYYFDRLFEDEGIEWYHRCFPPPRWKDGRRTITGEASPSYLFHPLVPERMAEVVPQARLIVLLRNPVDRAYSHYHHEVRRGYETRTFEEAIEAEMEAQGALSLGDGLDDARYGYLSWGIYADHLPRWSKFSSDEQMLVLKSENFFERTPETLKLVLDFLDLPGWEPAAPELPKRNTGKYEQVMDPATRRWLEDFFEPHNRRLYQHLGVDFGW